MTRGSKIVSVIVSSQGTQLKAMKNFIIITTMFGLISGLISCDNRKTEIAKLKREKNEVVRKLNYADSTVAAYRQNLQELQLQLDSCASKVKFLDAAQELSICNRHYPEYTLIYDSAKVLEEDYFNEKLNHNITRRDIKYFSLSGDSSELRNSKANVLWCNSEMQAKLLIWSRQNLRRLGLSSVGSIELKYCAEVLSLKNNVLILQGKLSGTGEDKNSKPWNIVWIGLKGFDFSKTVFAGVSFHGFSERRAEIKVEGIVDLNQDGYHDVVVNAIRYAGRLYEIFSLDSNGYKHKQLEGDSDNFQES